MMRVTYRDGRAAEYATYESAVAAVMAEWPVAVIGHDGDLADGGDRTLVWACEEQAEGDAGRNACASIRRATV